ncbi:sterol desaturase family protein [Acuticoccus yangtzensis]|uniref:sterol desaturase family protein n=1 Tax=Acuticoccus yangtzensis TaxID=1443441 RepID=UPI0009497735|nr:sterol desaturase family protein [Acuticoccus yangtzensis]ORE93615.1 fatty acid hydroxylase [Stappia sp. 22II-S9-Z10]
MTDATQPSGTPAPIPGQMGPVAMIKAEGLTAVFCGVMALTVVYFAVALSLGIAPLLLVGVFAAGVFYWTFLEYLLHRFVLHWEPEQPVLKAVRKCFPGHRAHHNKPSRFREDGLHMLKFFTWPSLFGVFFFWGVFAYAGFEPALPLGLAFTAGIQIGYLLYEFTHSACHFMPMKWAYAAHLKRHHAIHHHRDETVNYGVTTSIWDVAFRTTWKGRPKAAA